MTKPPDIPIQMPRSQTHSPGLILKLLVNSRGAQRVAKRAGYELVQDKTQNNSWKKHQLRFEIFNKLATLLQRISLIKDRTWIQQYLDKSYKQEFHKVKFCQIMKLEKIKTWGMKDQVDYSPVKAIVNISKSQLTTSKKSELNKGLNLATTIKQIPY